MACGLAFDALQCAGLLNGNTGAGLELTEAAPGYRLTATDAMRDCKRCAMSLIGRRDGLAIPDYRLVAWGARNNRDCGRTSVRDAFDSLAASQAHGQRCKNTSVTIHRMYRCTFLARIRCTAFPAVAAILQVTHLNAYMKFLDQPSQLFVTLSSNFDDGVRGANL
jgi:hypothetical protein